MSVFSTSYVIFNDLPSKVYFASRRKSYGNITFVSILDVISNTICFSSFRSFPTHVFLRSHVLASVFPDHLRSGLCHLLVHHRLEIILVPAHSNTLHHLARDIQFLRIFNGTYCSTFCSKCYCKLFII